MDAGDNAATELTPSLAVIKTRLRRLRMHVEDSGFFIAEADITGPVASLPESVRQQGGQLKSGRVMIKGTSSAFLKRVPITEELECHGTWVVDPRYGLQFDVNHIHIAIPQTLEALETYLKSGHLPHVGPVTAQNMVAKWGMDTLRVIQYSPELLQELPGITEAKAHKIQEAWNEKQEMYQVVSFLGLHGIGEGLAMKVKDYFGANALFDKIKTNPYCLMEVDGIGFKKADQVALSMGLPVHAPSRMRAALEFILKQTVQQEGNTAIPVGQWIDEAVHQLSRPKAEIQAICQELVNQRKVVLRSLDVVGPRGTTKMMCVSDARDALYERDIATHLRRLFEKSEPMSIKEKEIVQQIIHDKGLALDASQKEAMGVLFEHPVAVLTGGPGTGKTTTLRAVVKAAKEMGWSVTLAAPTGRAAKRMEEAMKSIGGEEAKTMHRCLKYSPQEGFVHRDGYPMPGKLFVIDEVSMVDTMMMNKWLKAMPDGARLVLVGDADQLPSVGAGDVLRDLIASKRLPVARLRFVHRQREGSGIAQAAQDVLAGKMPDMQGDMWRDDFVFVKTPGNPETVEAIENIIHGLLSKGYKHEDIQVLSPQKNHDCGTMSLNQRLRGILNPKNPSRYELEHHAVTIGERLMQVKNNYNLEVLNGDMGTVVEMTDDPSYILLMEDGREVTYKKADLRSLEMGYAITVHKSQGGERPFIIMPISKSHSYSLNRNLIYTGITRGKQKVILVGDPTTLAMSVKKKNQTVRTTGLCLELEQAGVFYGAKPKPANRPLVPKS